MCCSCCVDEQEASRDSSRFFILHHIRAFLQYRSASDLHDAMRLHFRRSMIITACIVWSSWTRCSSPSPYPAGKIAACNGLEVVSAEPRRVHRRINDEMERKNCGELTSSPNWTRRTMLRVSELSENKSSHPYLSDGDAADLET